MKYNLAILLTVTIAIALLLSACGTPAASGDGLNVVASTTLVGDVVKRVGGDHISLNVLLPVSADPHTFEPRPQDVAALSDARLVFINGLRLEESLQPVLEANIKGSLVEVSDGIEALPFQSELEHKGDQTAGEAHSAGDPHTWMDPNNVIVWTQNIATALSEADPANAQAYQANADAYIAELRSLDAWIRQQVEQVPAERRKLVSDHSVFGYFADEYGFDQVGLIVASFSTGAAPSAQELAALEDEIRQQAVPAIFVGTTVNPALSEQVARDTGARLIPIYTGSLGEVGGEADSYIKFMRYNVNAIVNGLK